MIKMPASRALGFTWWIGAATVAALGAAVMDFSVSWTAAGHGAQVAGLVVTLIVLPRTILLLFGGVVGDRWGPRRVMIVGDAAKCVLLVGVAVAAIDGRPSVTLLAAIGLSVGVITSFSQPATGVFPRLFVEDEELPQAMARIGGLLQVARLVGPPLGGILVVAWGLSGVAAVELVPLLGVLVVLIMIRPPREVPPTVRAGSTLHQIRGGLSAALRTPGIPPLLCAVGLVASSVLPIVFLCLPLAARERGWTAAQTGWIEAAWVVGTLCVTAVVAKIGARPRIGRVLILAPALATSGIVLLAATETVGAAMVATLIMGVGTAGFTTHVSPLFVRRTPEDMLVRFQSLLGIVQAAPLLVVNNVFGLLAAGGHSVRAMVAAALLGLAAATVCLMARSVRTAELSEADAPTTR